MSNGDARHEVFPHTIRQRWSRVFSLRHLASAYAAEPGDGFELGCALAAFWSKQEAAPAPSHDAIIDRLDATRHDRFTVLPLTVRLGISDPIFSDLCRRICALTLLKTNGHVQPLIAELAAGLLVMPRPALPARKAARDVGIVVAMAFDRLAGFHPYHSASKHPNADPSSSERLVATLEKSGVAVTVDAAEKAWRAAEGRLVAAGFAQDEASDFLCATSPVHF